MRQYYVERNNLFIKILIAVKQFAQKGKDYFNKHIDSFLKINTENAVEIELDVDYFFLNILGYRSKAKSMLLKHNEYFKNLIKEYKYVDPLTFFNEIYEIKQDFSEEDYIIFRVILKNVAKRKFYSGLK